MGSLDKETKERENGDVELFSDGLEKIESKMA
jgi:hypothetical protein